MKYTLHSAVCLRLGKDFSGNLLGKGAKRMAGRSAYQSFVRPKCVSNSAMTNFAFDSQ